MRDRLQARFPRWAEDAVFDSLAHIIGSGVKKGKNDRAFFSQFDSESGFLSYVLTASTNRAKDYAKKHKREVRTVPNAIDMPDSSQQRGPLDELLADEEVRSLEAAMQALSPQDHELIDLWLSGMTFREIAKLRNKPLSTISSRFQRIVAKLVSHIKVKTR